MRELCGEWVEIGNGCFQSSLRLNDLIDMAENHPNEPFLIGGNVAYANIEDGKLNITHAPDNRVQQTENRIEDCIPIPMASMNYFKRLKLEKNGDEYVIINENISEQIEVWDNLILLEGIRNYEQRAILSHNLTMLYVYLSETEPNRFCCGIDVFQIIFPLLRRTNFTEKMTDPSKFWNFVKEWLTEHVDWIDNISKKPNVDIELIVCETLANVLDSIMM